MQPITSGPVLLEIKKKVKPTDSHAVTAVAFPLQNTCVIAAVSKINKILFCFTSTHTQFQFPEGTFPAETITRFLNSLDKRVWWVFSKSEGNIIAINLDSVASQTVRTIPEYSLGLSFGIYKYVIDSNFIDGDSRELLNKAWARNLASQSNNTGMGQDLIAELNFEQADQNIVKVPRKSPVNLADIMDLKNPPPPQPAPLKPPALKAPAPQAPAPQAPGSARIQELLDYVSQWPALLPAAALAPPNAMPPKNPHYGPQPVNYTPVLPHVAPNLQNDPLDVVITGTYVPPPVPPKLPYTELLRYGAQNLQNDSLGVAITGTYAPPPVPKMPPQPIVQNRLQQATTNAPPRPVAANILAVPQPVPLPPAPARIINFSHPLAPPPSTPNVVDTLEKELEEQGMALLQDIQNREKRECLQKNLAKALALKNHCSGPINKKIIFVGLKAFVETILKIDPNVVSKSDFTLVKIAKIVAQVTKLFVKVNAHVKILIATENNIRQVTALGTRLEEIQKAELETKTAASNQELLWQSRARVAQMIAICNHALPALPTQVAPAVPAAASNKRKEDQEERKEHPKAVRDDASSTELSSAEQNPPEEMFD